MPWPLVRRLLQATVGAGLIVALALLAWGPGAGEPHESPVGIVADGDAASLIAARADDAHVDLRPYPSARAAHRAVRRGDLVAAVLVDLAQTTDTLIVDTGRSHGLRLAVADGVRAFEAELGRTIAVTDIGESGRAERTDRAVLVATLGGLLLGVVIVVVGWTLAEPVGWVPRSAVALTLGAVSLGAVTPLPPGLDPPGAWWADAAVLAVVAAVTASVTVVFSRAVRLIGLAMASGIVLGLAAPVALHVDGLRLPQPWRAAYPFTVPGAARGALADIGLGEAPWREVLVLGAWVVLVVIAAGSEIAGRSRPPRPLPLAHCLAAAAPATAMLLATAALLPADHGGKPAGEPLASTTRCLEISPPASVSALNELARTTRGGAAFSGGDVGADVRLQDGRQLWLFGDTLREDNSRGRFVRNSMLVLDRRCVSVVVSADGGAVIPDRDARVGYWPMSVGAERHDGYDLVAVGAQRVRSTGDEAMDFQSLGPAVALYVVPVGGTPQLLGVRDLGPDTTDRASPMWGAASHTSDGWLYLYGTATTGETGTFGYSLRVARTRPDEVTDIDSWTFWDGERWSEQSGDATELISARAGTSQTLSVWRTQDTWYALSKRDEYLGSSIVVWTAPAPTGPFTAQPPVADLPSDLAAGRLRYMPLAHPGLLPRRGTVVVSYSNNRTTTDAIIDNPREYRPRFLRVTLPVP